MLMLLASVFFSGFVLPVTDFAQWMQYIAYALPVTHGIVTLQQLMLRGVVVTHGRSGSCSASGSGCTSSRCSACAG